MYFETVINKDFKNKLIIKNELSGLLNVFLCYI